MVQTKTFIFTYFDEQYLVLFTTIPRNSILYKKNGILAKDRGLLLEKRCLPQLLIASV